VSDQKPTVGRIVHYYEAPAGSTPDFGGAFEGPFAAIVAASHSDTCATLAVLKPWKEGVHVASSSQRKDVAGGMLSYWEWPPRS